LVAITLLAETLAEVVIADVELSALKTFDTNRKFFRDSETGAAKLRMELLKVDDTFSGVSDTTGKAKDKMQEFIDKLQGVTKSQRSLKDATSSVEQANDKLGDAFANTAKAQAYFNKVTRGYAADSKEVISQNRAVADAQRNLVKANISAADSVKTLQAAEEALQKLREKVSPFDVESGEIQLQKAKFDVEQANFAVLDAEKELADLRNDPKSTPQTIREAEIALAESKFGVRDAIKSVSDAEEELNKLRNDTPTLKEIADAERVVADAKLAVEDANIALADSQANLNEQQEKLNELVNGAKEGSDAYTDALKELTDAQKAERDAINDRVEAYERLADATRDLAAAEKERNEAGKGLTPKQRAKAEAEDAARIAAGLQPALSTPAIPAIPEPFEFDFSNLDFSGIQFDFSNIGGFTPFATGGIVTKPTRALIGEAGAEAVIPLDRLESGLTVNVTINAGMGTDPAKLGDEIVDVLTRYQRRNGALPLKVA
jgi:peptidoglycan hydrolase CwlO-like protein